MALPRLTHLQFLVVARLLHGPAPGRDVRGHLKAEAVRQSGPAFYQMMAGLEDAGLVEGWYEQQIVDSQIIRERHYRVLPPGRKAWQQSRDFYLRTLDAAPPELAHGA